jgi:hypothetical protein
MNIINAILRGKAFGGTLILLGAFIASAMGVVFASQWIGSTASAPIVLHADTASAGKSISMATGIVDEGIEAFFVLDHLSGNLQCWIPNPRNLQLANIFVANVNEELGGEKQGAADYVMVTGRVDFLPFARRGTMVPAGCVCYVADGNTGKVVGYSFHYDQGSIKRAEQQNGKLEVVLRGTARDQAVQRDQ